VRSRLSDLDKLEDDRWNMKMMAESLGWKVTDEEIDEILMCGVYDEIFVGSSVRTFFTLFYGGSKRLPHKS
jgi:hypothetical protein